MATLDCLIQHLKEIRERAGRDVPLYLVDNDLVTKNQAGFREFFRLGRPNNRLTYDPDPHSPEGVIVYTG